MQREPQEIVPVIDGLRSPAVRIGGTYDVFLIDMSALDRALESARRQLAKFETVDMRIKASADEAFDLKGMSGLAELEILAEDAPADGKKKLPTFNMTAYTGGPMMPGGWYRTEPVVVDLAGMEIPSQTLPIDKGHGVAGNRPHGRQWFSLPGIHRRSYLAA